MKVENIAATLCHLGSCEKKNNLLVLSKTGSDTFPSSTRTEQNELISTGQMR